MRGPVPLSDRAPLNYRHAFHAGNFADLVKHAALLQLLSRLAAKGPLAVIDTHAGRGLYDLAGPEAQKSGEAEAGIARLMATREAPAAFEPLTAAVRRLNGGDEARRYPGSPWLVAETLRPDDSYLGCELRAEEHQALAQALRGRKNAVAICADGYQVAARQAPKGNVLVLIDPPFERADDYARIVETAAAVRRRNPQAVLLVWLPLKDLATFDAFLGDFEDEAGAPMVAECRIRPLSDPMRMNGCAVVLLGSPADLAEPLEAICRWTAETLGQGGEGRVWQA